MLDRVDFMERRRSNALISVILALLPKSFLSRALYR
jgi:hypothetical protein